MEHTVAGAGGTRIHVEEQGVGLPVLLVPGLGYAAWSWRPQATAVAQVARALSVDNRGTGRSDKPVGPYTMETMADDLACVLDDAGGGPALVVGASMGGYLAMTLARRRPDLVAGLVLVSTSVGGPRSTGAPESTLDVWRAHAGEPPEDYARATMPLSFAPGWTEEHPDRFEALLGARLEHPTPPESWKAQFDACEAFLAGGLPETAAGREGAPLDVPTHVVHGTADRVVPYANAEVVVERFPGAELVTMNGCGHLCWLERPHVVNRLLVQAAASLSGERGQRVR
ncbi:MAG TPA: alpha/beta hydrolase [Nocardioidaceae bacterium]|nr:alpha/beta hydrolase [Nocardioidaceae bacterium]